MATFMATGGPPHTQEQQDKAAAHTAIIAAALAAGAGGVNIKDLIANLTVSLPPRQAHYVTQASLRILCSGQNSILNIRQGTIITHRNAAAPNEATGK